MGIKITEIPMRFGTQFLVEITSTTYNPEAARPNITSWLKENKIQHIYSHETALMDYYFIIDEASIMAFKLRWM